jgi:putative transposase
VRIGPAERGVLEPKCLPNSLFVALNRTLLNFANYLVIRIIYKVQQALTRPWSWLPAPRVTRALDDFIDFHGKPKRIRIDNGPEYTSHHMQLWAKEQEIELQFIQPGKPTQNSYIERFNRTYRTEVLDAYSFTSMQEIRAVTEAFQHKYNHFRPHGSLNDMAPVEFKEHRKSLTGRPPSKGFNVVASKGENP